MKNNRLSGISSLAYLGTNAQQPPNMFREDRAPTQNDYLNFALGDFWIHVKSTTSNDSDLYVLMGVAGGVADWDLLSTDAGAVTKFTTDDANEVVPTNGNVNLSGAHGINTTGAASTATFAINNAIILGDLVAINAGSDALNCTTGDINITAGSLKLPNTVDANTGVIKLGSVPILHNFGTDPVNEASIFLGRSVGNFTNTSKYCIGIGFNTLSSITTSAENIAIGAGSLNLLTSASGVGANTAVGDNSGFQLLTGEANILIGNDAGSNYTGAESSNIIIASNEVAGGAGGSGVVGDNNTIRIGVAGSTLGKQDKCFIVGIRGVTTGVADAVPVLVDSANQLGTTSSSERYKQDIRSLGDASDVIYKLQPRFFHYKKHPTVPAWGLIAEEVDKIFPQLCVYDKDGRPDAVKYHDLPVLLLNELKKLNRRVEELESKVEKCTC